MKLIRTNLVIKIDYLSIYLFGVNLLIYLLIEEKKLVVQTVEKHKLAWCFF